MIDPTTSAGLVRIVVLSDGTWETVGGSSIYTITQEAYDALCEGELDPYDLTACNDPKDSHLGPAFNIIRIEDIK